MPVRGRLEIEITPWTGFHHEFGIPPTDDDHEFMDAVLDTGDGFLLRQVPAAAGVGAKAADTLDAWIYI
ncbi:MAG TPA: hypothetical protein VGO35_04830 [Gammaproteobacteria bacterium]|jgi:hypothetical protein|nr:hypothetical protein [Gammaproteobacteria bacterium]